MEVTNLPFPQEHLQSASLQARLLCPEKEKKEKSNASKTRASFTGIKKEKDAKHPINSHLSEAEPQKREHAVV